MPTDDTIREAAAVMVFDALLAIEKSPMTEPIDPYVIAASILAAVTPLIEAALIERLAEQIKPTLYLPSLQRGAYGIDVADWLRAQPEAGGENAT